jgi:hypothetical protein
MLGIKTGTLDCLTIFKNTLNVKKLVLPPRELSVLNFDTHEQSNVDKKATALSILNR